MLHLLRTRLIPSSLLSQPSASSSFTTMRAAIGATHQVAAASSAAAPSSWQPRRRLTPQQQQVIAYQNQVNLEWQAQQTTMAAMQQFPQAPITQHQPHTHQHHPRNNKHHQQQNPNQQPYRSYQQQQQQQHQLQQQRPFHSSSISHQSASTNPSTTTTPPQPSNSHSPPIEPHKKRQRRLPHFLAHQDDDELENMNTNKNTNQQPNIGNPNVNVTRSSSMPITNATSEHIVYAQTMAASTSNQQHQHQNPHQHHHQSHMQHQHQHHQVGHHQPHTNQALQRSQSAVHTHRPQQPQQGHQHEQSFGPHQPPKRHPHVTYMPPHPTAVLPKGFNLVYARTRTESDRAASELLAMLTAESESLAAPDTSQHVHQAAKCDCPPVHIGFDVEWRPTFIKGMSQNPVALIQLATDTHAYLFQVTNWTKHILRTLPPIGAPANEGGERPFKNVAELHKLQNARARILLGDALCTLLCSPRFLKVGVGIKGDVQKLHADYGIQMDGVIDLSEYANERPDGVKLKAKIAADVLPSALDAEAVAAAVDAAAVGDTEMKTSDDSTSAMSTSASPPVPAAATPVSLILAPAVAPLAASSLPASSPTPSIAASSSISELPFVFNQGWSLASLVTYTMHGLTLAKPKSIRLSNWENPLRQNALNYAALDAYVGWKVYQRLHEIHIQEKNCVAALAAGRGENEKKKEKVYIPVQVVVKNTTTTTTTTSNSNNRPRVAASASSSSPTSIEQISAAAFRINSQSPEVIDLVDDDFLSTPPPAPIQQATKPAGTKRARFVNVIDE